jgi:hypothetical protein
MGFLEKSLLKQLRRKAMVDFNISYVPPSVPTATPSAPTPVQNNSTERGQQVSEGGTLSPTVAAPVTDAQVARNKVLAKEIASGSVSDAKKVLAKNQAEIDGFSDAVKQDLTKRINAEMTAREVTDKGFMEKYGNLILLAVQAALSGFYTKDRTGASNWWASANPAIQKAFANTGNSDGREKLIT